MRWALSGTGSPTVVAERAAVGGAERTEPAWEEAEPRDQSASKTGARRADQTQTVSPRVRHLGSNLRLLRNFPGCSQARGRALIPC